MQVLVVLPTYNEAENIDAVLRQVRAAAPDATLLVVDDASPDGTAKLAEETGADIGNVEIMGRPGKAGLGSAYRDGFAWGLERDFDAFVQIDSDLSHDPASIPSLLEPLADGYELIIGSRYVAGGSIPDWKWHRRLLSKAGNLYSSTLLGLRVADSTAGYRVYAASLLRRIDLDTVRADSYGFQIEMTYRAIQRGARVREVPIRFVDRVEGTSKMSFYTVAEALGLVTLWGVERAVSSARRRAADARQKRRSGARRLVADAAPAEAVAASSPDPEPSSGTAGAFVIDTGGGGERHAVVLVHGQPGVARDWQPVVSALAGAAPELRVLVPDRPGWGDCPDDAGGFDVNAEWLERQLASVVGADPVVIAGHSFGGGVAIRHASVYPERVAALVLVSSVGRDEALSPLDRALAHPMMGESIVRGGLFAARRVGRVVNRRLATSAPDGDLAKRVEKVALLRALTGAEGVTERAWRSFLVEQRALVDETPMLQESLTRLRVPTVVLAGSTDRIVPPAANRALAISIPGAELVTVAGAGHLLPVEVPDVVAGTITRYARLTA